MKTNTGWILLPALFACLALIMGCGETHQEKDGHAHGPEQAAAESKEEETEIAGASYKEGRGIALLPETEKSLGLELAEVGENNFQQHFSLAPQIYRSANESSRQYGKEKTGNAYATALVAPEIAKQLQPGSKLIYATEDQPGLSKTGTIWKLDSSQLPILGKVEALLELPDPGRKLAVGAFVKVQVSPPGQAGNLVSIPRSAVLATSTGKFAYVQNGGYLLRTEIKTGKENPEFIEVTEGLYEGDTIATKPVENLYLFELRATKGGGHSH